ncbi:MAG: hypothetical protein KDD44_07720 [Bdellovibrionales bacterium]|nr:hypothetical protein [Bdellovibrionales bacterium]
MRARNRRAASNAAFLTRKPVRIHIVTTVSEARRYLKRGWCPVECSFGATSVVDNLQMDHHGSLSHLEGVAVRAYRDHFGARRGDPRFLGVGMPDEDWSFAVASLCGVLPHPSLVDSLDGAPAEIRDIWSRDFSLVAQIVNEVDTDPTRASRLLEDHWGKLVLAWRLLTNARVWDEIAFHEAVARWRTLLTQRNYELAKVAPSLLEARLEEVRSAPTVQVSEHVALIDCSLWGFSSVYVAEWHKIAPIVLCYYGDFVQLDRGRVTVCARGRDVAEDLLGEGGLKRIYPRLRPSGWGGREDIGGSNRERPLSRDQARQAAESTARFVERRLRSRKGGAK